MLNSLPSPSAVRQPRGIIRITTSGAGWQVLPGWIECEVESNMFDSADMFRVKLAANSLPASNNLQWFASQAGIMLEVFAGFPKDPENFTTGDLQLLIAGDVDCIEYAADSGTLNLSGRDYTGRLIDNKSDAQYRSRTASQLALQFAAEQGLGAVVTATKSKVGIYYAEHSDALNASKSEWDILTTLAKKEGFVCYVKGTDLHFEPAPTEAGDPYVLQWLQPDADQASARFNGTQISFERRLSISRGISVVVTAASLKSKTPVKAIYPTSTRLTIAAGQSKLRTQTFNVEAPAGTDKAAAMQIAQSKYRELIAHEMKLTASMPADNLLDIAQPIMVVGTGTDYDQLYFPDSVVRTMSARNGYTMRVTAKNRNPNTVT